MQDSHHHVAIVGGGFSGTALAIHLLRCGNSRLRVSLIEPSGRLAVLDLELKADAAAGDTGDASAGALREEAEALAVRIIDERVTERVVARYRRWA